MTYDIAALKRRMRNKYPYFGSVVSNLEYEENDRIHTTAGNGKTIFYNPDYMAGLTADEQLFALAHEICHVAFDHIRRSRGKDQQVWKAATDAVVNQLLLRDGLDLPPGAIDYPEAIEYDAESYYEILLQQKLEIEMVEGNMQKPEGIGEEGGQGDMKAGDGQEDDHSLWEDAAEKSAQEQEDQEEELRKELQKIQNMAEGLFDIEEEFSEDGGAEADSQDEDGERGLVQKKSSRAGNDVRPDTREVDNVGSAPPLLDWRMILKETLNYGVDWSFVHAVLEDGIVRPILEEQAMAETEIVLDTSWSVDDDLLRNFLRECKNILPYSKLKAGCFDTVFYGFQEIRSEQDIENMVFEGGGGTDFNAAVGAFSLRVDNRIIFTDGEAPLPDTPLDAVWMIYGDRQIEPEGGRVIHIPPEYFS